MDEIIRPTVAGMAADGNTYTGFLYAGLMISPTGTIDVVEFNCRFGDPEAQPVMMRLQSDLVEHCLAAVNGTLDTQEAEWDPRPAVGIVLAAGGYPESYASGETISGLDDAQEDACAKIFHAGTKLDGDNVVTSGGRVRLAHRLLRHRNARIAWLTASLGKTSTRVATSAIGPLPASNRASCKTSDSRAVVVTVTHASGKKER